MRSQKDVASMLVPLSVHGWIREHLEPLVEVESTPLEYETSALPQSYNGNT